MLEAAHQLSYIEGHDRAKAALFAFIGQRN